MKIYTNISHINPETNQKCNNTLFREFLGFNDIHRPLWHLTCESCIFDIVVDCDTYRDWGISRKIISEI